LNSLRDFLLQNNFEIQYIDNKKLKAFGATVPNVNWKTRVCYSLSEDSPNNYLVNLRYSAKWKPLTSIVVGVLTGGLGWIVGAATFTGYIVQAEKEFNQMWSIIESSIGSNIGVVSQLGFGQYNPSVPQEYQQQEIQRQQQQQLQQQQLLQQQQAVDSQMRSQGAPQLVGQEFRQAQPGSLIPPSVTSPSVQEGQTITSFYSETVQQVPMHKMPMQGATIGGEEILQPTGVPPQA
jgi:hypothetical protein